MTAKIGAICFLLLITAVTAPAYSTGQGEWIISYRVEDLKTKQVVLERDFESDTITEYAPIFAGGEYNLTITIKVAISVPYATLKLESNIEHSTLLDRYWELHSSAPPTVVNYNPNQKYIELKQEKGNLVVSLYGKIPDSITERKLDGWVVLHKTTAYKAVQLKGPDSEILDNLILDMIDAKIYEYQNLLNQKRIDLQSLEESEPRVVPAYVELLQDVIAQAEAEAKQGFVDKAIRLLNLLTTDEVPREHIPTWMETLFIPVTVGLGVVAVVLATVSLRLRGRLSYVLLVIEDQIRDLEGLTFRASRIDKDISSSLENIKERLKRLVGA